MIAAALAQKAKPTGGAASLKVDLHMPILHDNNFDFWKHWHACQNVARCQTVGRELNDLDFLSIWMTRFQPEGGVRAQTIKTEYERAAQKGRLPWRFGTRWQSC